MKTKEKKLTADLLVEYRKYALKLAEDGKDFKTFSEWKAKQK